MIHDTLLRVQILYTTSQPTTPAGPYTLAAFCTLLVYDYFCTFADEVSLVWSQPLNIGSIVYFLNRYPPFIDTSLSLYLLTTVQTPELCLHAYKAVTWLIVLGVFVSELILMIRTYAIFERKRSILVVLCFLMAMIFIPGTLVVHLEMASLKYGYPTNGPYRGCYLAAHASPVIGVAYLLVLASETIIVTMTAYKAVQHLRRSRASLVVNLYRNGLLFYVYILFISLANVIVPFTAPTPFVNLFATPQRVFHSLICTRILLSILHDRKRLLQPACVTDVDPSSETTTTSRRINQFSTILPTSDGTDSMELMSYDEQYWNPLRTDDLEVSVHPRYSLGKDSELTLASGSRGKGRASEVAVEFDR